MAVGIVVLLPWVLAPGVGELLENLAHYLEEGHSAHGAPDGDHHDSPGPEHGCTAAVHLCSCCTSASFLQAQSTSCDGSLTPYSFVVLAEVHPPAITSPDSVYHPPRA